MVDVSSGSDVERGVAEVAKRFGRVDILVNNVAISDNKTIIDLTEEEWDRVMSVTLKGPFLMGKFVAKQMIAQGDGGKIVNIASTSGWRGRPRAIAYTTAKGGVINLTRSMAVQLAPHNIRVNSVSPEQGGLAGRQRRIQSRPADHQSAEAAGGAFGRGQGGALPGLRRRHFRPGRESLRRRRRDGRRYSQLDGRQAWYKLSPTIAPMARTRGPDGK